MNNIQKFIKRSEDEAEKSYEEYLYHNSFGQYEIANYYMKYYTDFSEHAAKLTLLLKDESNQPQPPISQTPMLGEVP